MKITGYKALDKNKCNIHGLRFTPGFSYYCDKPIKFGTNGNGFHFAQRLEDTLRYINSDKILREPLIAKVIGYGNIKEGYDEYNGYYNLYSASNLKVIKYLSRDEIIKYAMYLLNNNCIDRLERFISLYKLSNDEIILFEGKFIKIDLAINYYQRGYEDTYCNYYKIKKLWFYNN